MSGHTSRAATSNRLLSSLAPADFALLKPFLSALDLPLRKQLELPNKAIDSVYFLDAGFASVVANGNGQSIEVGLIGREGMTGLAVVMGADRSPNATYMQLAGHGRKISAADLRDAMSKSETLRASFLRYGHAFIVQTSHTALANGRNKVEERLARWLLMARDRNDGNELMLTHEFMSIMLGVRRAGVTVALDMLEKKSLVRVRRGGVTILDRRGLEKMTNGAYGVPEAEFKRLCG
jgi:CRP-like cAMP-binding protein